MGFGVKHAIIYYAEVRWPPMVVYVTTDPIDEGCQVMETVIRKVAEAARRYHKATGTIPTCQTVLVDAGYLLPDSYDDEFSRRRRNADFKFRVDGENLYIWSVGPDRTNDGGVIRYDPTNGLKSGGDIIIVVEF